MSFRDRLPQYNSSAQDDSTNPYGFGGGGHLTNVPLALSDVAEAVSDVRSRSENVLATVPDYDPTSTYSSENAVLGSDGIVYRCLVNGTTGDDPVGSVTGNWKRIGIEAIQVPEYVSDAVYNIGDIAWSNGAGYRCLADDVTGDDPATSVTGNWTALAGEGGIPTYSATATYDSGAAVWSAGAGYRCLADGVTGDDPATSVTGNWTPISKSGVPTASVHSTDFTFLLGARHVITGTCTGTLPEPMAGESITFTVADAAAVLTIANPGGYTLVGPLGSITTGAEVSGSRHRGKIITLTGINTTTYEVQNG